MTELKSQKERTTRLFQFSKCFSTKLLFIEARREDKHYAKMNICI